MSMQWRPTLGRQCVAVAGAVIGRNLTGVTRDAVRQLSARVHLSEQDVGEGG